MRRAAKKDDNHKEIDEAFKSLGYSTVDTSQLKKACDLIAVKRPKTFFVEIKDGKKPPSQRKLTEGEKEFADKHPGYWVLVTSVEDVIKLDEKTL